MSRLSIALARVRNLEAVKTEQLSKANDFMYEAGQTSKKLDDLKQLVAVYYKSQQSLDKAVGLVSRESTDTKETLDIKRIISGKIIPSCVKPDVSCGPNGEKFLTRNGKMTQDAIIYIFIKLRTAEGKTTTVKDMCEHLGQEWNPTRPPYAYEVKGRLLKKGWIKSVSKADHAGSRCVPVEFVSVEETN